MFDAHDLPPSAVPPDRGLYVVARPARRNRAANPYNALIYDAMHARDARIDEYFGGRWLLSRQRPDIFHVHWPESVFNHDLAGAWLVSQTLLRAIDVLRARGTRCVWTVHNLAAHERRHVRAEAALWRAFTRRLDGFIALSDAGLAAARARFPELAGVPGFVIAHPHFRGAYPDAITRREARVRLGLSSTGAEPVIAFVGRILAYKNVPALVRAFRGLDAHAQLMLAGKPRTAALAHEIRRAQGDDARVRTWFRAIADDELQCFLRAADLVVLPYREILNSGSAMLALSFDRPVLLPNGASVRELRACCGAEWVFGYDELDANVLVDCSRRAARLPERTDGAFLAARDPQRIAAETLRAYRAVLQERA